MTTPHRKDILLPPGRLVMGSLVKPQTTDADGKPLVVKSGPNQGQTRVNYFFAVAIPKTPGVTHWASEVWGAEFWAIGHATFPGGQATRTDFAWKIVDGDSAIPNKKGQKPCDREGYKGHWVVSCSSGFAPKCYNADGSATLDAAAIKLGDFVQVNTTADGNESTNQPGIYINHNGVSFQWAGKEIYVGTDPSSVGFGKGVVRPAGASAAPTGSFTPPVPAVVQGASPPAPVAPAIPGATVVIPAPAAPTAVVPVPGFVPAPVAPAAPPAPPTPVIPMGKQLTGKATSDHPGITYAQFIAHGWNDQQLRDAGYLLAA